MVGLGELGSNERTGIPDRDKVVVTTSGKLGTISAPLQATDLSSVRDQLSDLVVGDADIMVEDEAGAGTGGENVLVPC